MSVLDPALRPWWDEEKNDKPFDDVDARAARYTLLYWRCPRGHQFGRNLRALGQSPECPTCGITETSFAAVHPRLAARWHSEKNGALTPDQIPSDFGDSVWWACPFGHAFEASPRAYAKDDGCPHCAMTENSLQARYPRLAAQWHPDKNAGVSPSSIDAQSPIPAWWRCPRGHEFHRPVRSMTQGTGACPTCYGGWSVDRIKDFVRSLLDNLDALNPSEIFSLAMQAGVFKSGGAYRFALAISSGALPKEELEKFVEDKPSAVDLIARGDDGDFSLENPTAPEADEGEPIPDRWRLRPDHDAPMAQRGIGLEVDALSEAEASQAEDEEAGRMPLVQAGDALETVAKFAASADEETVRFLLDSALVKLWRHAYVDADVARRQAEEFAGKDAYSGRVRKDFLRQLDAAQHLKLPPGYAFRLDPAQPHPTPPLLMQRHVAVALSEKKTFGNWSGMGAGKTLSAILATRVVEADLTVVCCPNAVVGNWTSEIQEAFEGVAVRVKTWEPDWGDHTGPKYLILNYEMFQQPDSEARMVGFLDREVVEALVIDEIHFAKQRSPRSMSRRKRLVQGLRMEGASVAKEHGKTFYVLGLSGTPVINELQEGKSLVEMITGVRHDDLKTKATVQNCMRLYQKLVTWGTRWQPPYVMALDESKRPEVDCSPYLDDLRALGSRGASPLQIEQVLTRVRMPAIVEACVPGEKTLIYTHYVQGIVGEIYRELRDEGLHVGIFTGQTDEADLERFMDPHSAMDVLIASSRVSTGVDGLQHVCARLVVNVLPWTRAEYEQLRGRLWRQGSPFDTIEVVVPVTYADLPSGRWSYCESKLERLAHKQSIAEAAVDGQIPAGTLRTPAQAQRDIFAWLDRLDGGAMATVARPPVVVPLSKKPYDVALRMRTYGDFSRMNNRWYASSSHKTHERLQHDPQEWAHYHTMYRDLREGWDVVPFEEEIAFWSPREGKTLGDFGCGEALIAQELCEQHKVWSFDHVAINDDVLACDMSQVPVFDDELDGAIFCLSLMGHNFTEYVREAHRCLRIDGRLHIWEPKGRLKDAQGFSEGLRRLGFINVVYEERGGFVCIQALKGTHAPQDHTLSFG